MSYLDVPRLHFSGKFKSDPSTINNTIGRCCGGDADPANCAYDSAIATPGGAWNPGGTHHFALLGCTVKSVVDGTGRVQTTAIADAMVGATVTALPDGRLVDLDPAFQSGSQIWGLGIQVRAATGESVSGTMATAAVRELWALRAPGGFAAGFSGAYQSVLTDVQLSPALGPYRSAILNGLRGSTRLSIRLACSAYQADPLRPGFMEGDLVGTIGPAVSAEPAHGVTARRLVHGGASQTVPFNAAPFNAAPFKVDSVRRRLVVDLGNALPEDTPAGPRPASLAPLAAEIVKPVGGADRIGTLPLGRPRYLERAGIEELPLTAAQVTALDTRRLQLVTTGPPAVLRLAEEPGALHLEVSDTVVRLNPGESADISVYVTAFGKPLAGKEIHVAPSYPGGVLTALSVRKGSGVLMVPLPLPGKVTTDAAGIAQLRLVAGDPAHPRAHIDGAVSFLGLFVTSVAPANKRAQIAVRVFDTYTVPPAPTWSDAGPILKQYARLYPAMQARSPLDDHAKIKAKAGAFAAFMRFAVTDPFYMPITRDLSRDKRDLLLKWLDAGAP